MAPSRGGRLLLLLLVLHLSVPSGAWLFSFFGSSAGSKDQDVDSTDMLTEWQAEELQELERDVPLPVTAMTFVDKQLTPLDIQAAEAKVTGDGRKLYPSCGMVRMEERSCAANCVHCGVCFIPSKSMICAVCIPTNFCSSALYWTSERENIETTISGACRPEEGRGARAR